MSNDLTPPFSMAEAVEILAACDCGTPIGYRRLSHDNPPICTEPCLAPGSSPHAHTTTRAWQLIGTTGIIEVDPVTECVMRASVVHPLSKLDEVPA